MKLLTAPEPLLLIEGPSQLELELEFLLEQEFRSIDQLEELHDLWAYADMMQA